MSYQEMLDARAIRLHDAECGDRSCEPHTMGKWYHIARSEAIVRDGKALDFIAAALDGTEWDADHLEVIAEVVRGTGRQVRDPNDIDEQQEGTT